MSDNNLPAVQQQAAALPAAPAERTPATADVDSWIQVMRPVIALAEHIAGTEFVPKGLRNSVPATTAAMLYGREVGLAPMTALTQTHVIEGKPSMSAEAMRALVLAQGHELIFDEATGAVVRMRARRSGSNHWTELAWTIDMARAAGITHKDNWKKYPRAMLIARCTADICRMVFPDVIHGFRAVEEFDEQLADADEEPAAPTTKVARKRAAAKKAAPAAAPALEQPAARPSRPDGPPLPGEDGYDTPTPRDAAPEQAGEVSEGAQVAGEADAAPAVETDAEETPEQQPGEGAESGPQEPSPEQDARRNPRAISRAQQRMLMGQFSGFDLGGDDARDERLGILSKLVQRDITSSSDLSSAEASRVIDTLGRVEDAAQLLAIANGVQS
jgi:hypothetical protein